MPVVPPLPLPSGAFLAWDTRLWTEGDASLENLGSAGTDYDLPIVSDGAFDNAYGTQVNNYYGDIDTASSPGTGIDWTDLGGTPGVGGVFTFIIATGAIADGAGYAEIGFSASTFGNAILAAVENYDGTSSGPNAIAFFGDPMFTVDSGLTTFEDTGTDTSDTVFFFEVDLTGTPYIEIRQGQTLVASDTHAAYGAGAVDAIYDPGLGFTVRMAGADIGWSSIAWRMRGSAMVRGVLDSDARTEWIAYFLTDPVVPSIGLPFQYSERWQDMSDDPDWWARAEYRDTELEDYLATREAEQAAELSALRVQVAALIAIVGAL